MIRTRKTSPATWVAAAAALLLLTACSSRQTEAPAAAAEAAPATEVPAAAAPAGQAEAPAAATEAPAAESEAPVAESAPAAAATEIPAPEAASADAAAAARTFTIDPGQSEVSYFVEEEFLGRAVEFVTAIGRTSAIEGSLELSVGESSVSVGSNEFSVDLRTLTSDQRRRDNAIRDRWLQSNTYPFAVFVAREVADLPADAALGLPVAFKLNGEMTIREITQPLTWDVTATLDGDTLSGTAQSYLLMRDFGFEPPDIAGMLRVTDGVTLTMNFVATAAE